MILHQKPYLRKFLMDQFQILKFSPNFILLEKEFQLFLKDLLYAHS